MHVHGKYFNFFIDYEYVTDPIKTTVVVLFPVASQMGTLIFGFMKMRENKKPE